MDKNLDIQVEEALKAYLASRVEDPVDYQKFYLYSIVTPYTAIEGSTVTEIHSPGSLPNGLTVEDIKNGTSIPRNMFLFTNANYLLPYTGAGSSVRRALEYDPDVTFSNGVNDREITHSANEFVITIPRKSTQANNQTQSEIDPSSPKSEQPTDQTAQNTTKLPHNTDPAYPKSEQPTDQAPHNMTQLAHTTDPAYPKSEQPYIKLSQKQKDIRNFCSIPRTAKEIMNRLALSDFYNNRKRYIYDLVEDGVLERTIPDKPNDPNQKYRRKQ